MVENEDKELRCWDWITIRYDVAKATEVLQKVHNPAEYLKSLGCSVACAHQIEYPYWEMNVLALPIVHPDFIITSKGAFNGK